MLDKRKEHQKDGGKSKPFLIANMEKTPTQSKMSPPNLLYHALFNMTPLN